MKGLPDQALLTSERAVVAAREMNHGPSEEFAVGYQAEFFHLLRDHERTLSVAADSYRLGKEHRSAFWHPMITTYEGWALVAQGDIDEGITLMRDGLTRYAAAGNGLTQVHMMTLLAEGLGIAKRYDDAFATLADAAAVVTATGEAYFEPEVHRLRGEFLRRQAIAFAGPERTQSLATAEECIRTAIEIARRQGAKSLELRAVTSLCVLQRDQGDDAEGTRLLADVLGSFTEGFDTPDLRDARDLVAGPKSSR
jgi:adenylate cyclase